MSVIDLIKQQYPNPIPVPPLTRRVNRAIDYCVGGAICGYVAHTDPTSTVPDSPFPPEKVLALALHALNPDLTPGMALEWAAIIISANDDRRFDDAWQYAEAATNLSYKDLPL